MIGLSIGVTARGGGLAVDADYTAYTAAVTAAGGSLNQTELDAVSAFIAGLKTDSLWTQLTWLYVPLGTFAGAGVAMKGSNPTLTGITATEYGRTGSTGGFACANNRYVLSPLEPNRNAGGIGGYHIGSAAFVTTMTAFGAQDAGATQVHFAQWATSTTMGFRHGGTPAVSESSSPGLTAGLYSVERISTGDLRAYRNAVQISTTQSTVTAPASPGCNVAFMGRNVAGTVGQFLQPGQYWQAGYLSTGLVGADVTKMNNRLVTLLTAVGRNA